MSLKPTYPLWLALCLAPGAAGALSSDKQQPITITADSVEIDDKAGRAVYRGNVRVTQGTLRVTGDTLVVERQDGEVRAVIITGGPATYRQRPDGGGQDVAAKAGVMRVYPQANMVTLEENAEVRQRGRVFSGHIIEYDNKNDIVRARGQADGAEGAKARARIVLPPE